MGIFPSLLCGNPQVLHNHNFSVWSSYKLTARCSYSSREGLAYLHPYVLCHVEGLAGKIAGGTTSCSQVKPNLSLWSPVGIFWVGCLPERGDSAVALFPAKSKPSLYKPQNFENWVKEVEKSDDCSVKYVRIYVSQKSQEIIASMSSSDMTSGNSVFVMLLLSLC